MSNPFLTYPTGEPAPLPLFREWAYDFANEHIIMRDGRAELLSGQKALEVWIYKAILTHKNRYRAYSPQFGSELETLVGTNYSLAAARGSRANDYRGAVPIGLHSYCRSCQRRLAH